MNQDIGHVLISDREPGLFSRIIYPVSEPECRDIVHINKTAPVLWAVNVELRNDIFNVKYLMRRNREFAPCNVSSAASAAAVRNPGVS